jgi:two-component system response regulator MprA
VSKRVLVVDDDAGIRQTLQDVLELEGYEVTIARNGVEALRKLDDELPSLMILDIMMPIMDGYTVAANLKSRGLSAQLPVLVLTADRQARARIRDLGADAYLEKPFSLDELLREVERIIRT